MKESELFKLKEKIDSVKPKVAELKGQQTAVLQQLKTDYKCNSVEESQEALETMESEIESLNKKIDKGLKELSEKYE